MTLDLVTVSATAEGQLEALREQVREFEGQIPDKLIVSNHSEAQYATELLARIKKIRDRAETERKETTKPILDAKAELDSQFKEVTEPLGRATEVIKQGILGYQREQQRLADEQAARERAEADEARKQAEIAAKLTGEPAPPSQDLEPPPPPKAPTRITTGAGSAGVRQNWKVEIEDVKVLCAAVAAGTVPVQAIAPNAAFLRTMITSLPKDAREGFTVPGVRYFQDATLAVR